MGAPRPPFGDSAGVWSGAGQGADEEQGTNDTGQVEAPVEEAGHGDAAQDEGDQPARAAEGGDDAEPPAHGGEALTELLLLKPGVGGHGDGLRHPRGPPRRSAVRRRPGCERRADDAERQVTRAAVQHASDFRQLHLYAEIGRSLEAAADALKWAGLILREYVLGTVLDV